MRGRVGFAAWVKISEILKWVIHYSEKQSACSPWLSCSWSCGHRNHLHLQNYKPQQCKQVNKYHCNSSKVTTEPCVNCYDFSSSMPQLQVRVFPQTFLFSHLSSCFKIKPVCIPPGRDPVLVLWGESLAALCSSAGKQHCRWSRHSWSPPWPGAALWAPHPAGSVHQSGSAANSSEPAATPPALREKHRQWGVHRIWTHWCSAAKSSSSYTCISKTSTRTFYLL